ncbi:MAG TPA: ECF transporter S component [Treponemataceae bacterium]|jgi:niacin transporter|nr:ECF transporter S component [Treponemataceae bacterium]
MSIQRNTAASRTLSSSLLHTVLLTILFTALGVSLPVIFHRLGIAAIRFSPMHFPVLLSSLLLGPVSGLIVGIFSVLFSMMITGMPVLFPTGIAMLFELAAYGISASLLQKKLFPMKKNYLSFLASLVIAMIAGRLVHGLVQYILTLFTSSEYSLLKFWNGCFTVSFPGIVLQIVLLPFLALAVSKSGLFEEKK